MFTAWITAYLSIVDTVVVSCIESIQVVLRNCAVLLLPHCHYPATLGHRHILFDMSPDTSLLSEPSTTSSMGHKLGRKIQTLTHSRLPVLAKLRLNPKTRRTFFLPAPIPLAPVLDIYTFESLPSFPAHPESNEETDLYLSVPNNTPIASPPTSSTRGGWTTGDSSTVSSVDISLGTPALFQGIHRASMGHQSLHQSGSSALVGLGFEGIEKNDGSQFDGLGRLSGGVKSPVDDQADTTDTSEEPEDGLNRSATLLIIERARRSRAKTIVQPRARYDVFFPMPNHSPTSSPDIERGQSNRTVQLHHCRRRPTVTTPTPGSSKPRAVLFTRDLSRSTTSTELKRIATLERRASFVGTKGRVTWRG
ncbi:hypothetical protein BJ138DRAFT_1138877 [Hygrophoropsis aurantiaca]|uniref:Uncharacterized protein n=1 Tax=Hygrophoropsis aurantiaca TaxID=72124 RepID=A0ACB8AUI9_9AGAM|nr:hypothetical protein BJ138DRAFT_1138877 [Hygrophoropsis aurantiaca]